MPLDDYLIQTGIAKTLNRQTKNFAVALPSLEKVFAPYSEFTRKTWDALKQDGLDSGDVFELMIATLLYHSGISVFYRHATIKFLEHTDFDLLLWDEQNAAPVLLQCTSTLRERFRLADLESFRSKSFYPNAKTYLLTMDYRDTARLTDYKFDSLDRLIYAGDRALDELFEYLRSRTFSEPPGGALLMFKSRGLEVTQQR